MSALPLPLIIILMEFSAFKKKIQYEFKNDALLEEACRHSSYVNEQEVTDLRDNERLEFLGDAVLNLVVGHILMHRYPHLPEGDLSRMRASLVNEFQLAKVAKAIDLGDYVLLGKGEIQTNGREKKSILADTFEAIIAAVYLDGGFDAAFRFIEHHFLPIFIKNEIRAIAEPNVNYDYKTRLQEVVQVTPGLAPVYTVTEESGPPHDRTFIVQIAVADLCTEGTGKSKKMAEQNAARKALEMWEVRIVRSEK